VLVVVELLVVELIVVFNIEFVLLLLEVLMALMVKFDILFEMI
jgi:hypothetical protein